MSDAAATSAAPRRRGWIGVDLDGTLAQYDRWRGAAHIGEPIPAMVRRVQTWLAEGTEVRIMTARVWAPEPERTLVEKAIRAWCIKHLGADLRVTNAKDFEMIELWDDRAFAWRAAKAAGISVDQFVIRQYSRAWENVVPEQVAYDQLVYDLDAAVLRMRKAGMTFREIGNRLGVTAGRASQRAKRAIRRGASPCPVEVYFAEHDPALHTALRRVNTARLSGASRPAPRKGLTP